MGFDGFGFSAILNFKEVPMYRFSRIALMSVFSLLVVAPQSPWAKSMTLKAPPKKISPAAMMVNADKRDQDAVLASLEAGNARYRKGFAKADAGEVAQGPKVMVLACSDPRVIPEKIFNAKPGELFVVRVAGNVATNETVASLEYGAEQLHIPVLVVLGHENCTVVKSCLDAMETPDPEHRRSMVMKSLYSHLEPACEVAKGEGLKDDRLLNKAVEENVKNSIRAVLENSPSMWNMHHKGKLRVVGALYSKHTGQVYWLDK
jgi:carbonic anhydrase